MRYGSFESASGLRPLAAFVAVAVILGAVVVMSGSLAMDPAHAPAKAELKKWLPRKNSPHFGAPKRK